MKPTEKEIRAECDALRQRRAGDLTNGMHDELEAMIDALTGELDPTAPEFTGLAYHERKAATEALEWQEGMNRKRPSEYWSNTADETRPSNKGHSPER